MGISKLRNNKREKYGSNGTYVLPCIMKTHTRNHNCTARGNLLSEKLLIVLRQESFAKHRNNMWQWMTLSQKRILKTRTCHVQGHRTGCRTGNGDQLSSSQAEPGQAIKSAVAYFPAISCETSCPVALYRCLYQNDRWLHR